MWYNSLYFICSHTQSAIFERLKQSCWFLLVTFPCQISIFPLDVADQCYTNQEKHCLLEEKPIFLILISLYENKTAENAILKSEWKPEGCGRPSEALAAEVLITMSTVGGCGSQYSEHKLKSKNCHIRSSS